MRSDAGGACAPAAGGAAGDDRDFPFSAFIEQKTFVGEAVNGVDEVIKAVTKYGIGGLGGEKFGAHVHDTIGVDAADTRGEFLDFRFAKAAFQGMDLPVGVGDAHFVQIHEGEAANARAGQCLVAPRAHAAHTDDRYARGAQFG